MYRDRDDIRLSERERRAIAELEAAFHREDARLSHELNGAHLEVWQWIGPALMAGVGTMLMAVAPVSSLWLIVLGSLLMVGGIALLAVR